MNFYLQVKFKNVVVSYHLLLKYTYPFCKDFEQKGSKVLKHLKLHNIFKFP